MNLLRIAAQVGADAEIGNAIFQFQWARHVEDIPPAIRWGLYAINIFFSTLLLVTGLLVIGVAWSRAAARPPGLWVVAGGAAFWAVNFAYLMVRPMPLPDSLAAVGLVLVLYSFAALVLHVVPLGWYVRRHLRANGGE